MIEKLNEIRKQLTELLARDEIDEKRLKSFGYDS